MKNKSYSPKGGLTVLTVLQRSGLAVLTVCALALTSCEDFFSNVSPSAETIDKVFSNPALTEQAICGAYQELAKDKGYINRLGCGYQGLNTDCEWSSWSTGTDDRATCVTYSMTVNNSAVSNKNGSDPWSYFGTVIERCNNAIDGIRQYSDTTDPAMRYYLGEAYFLRSFAYLEMIKYWGDVPARFTSLTQDQESVNARKTDRNVIYEQLRIDLREAARLMPYSNDPLMPATARNKVGRGSRTAALALLARADLMYAGKAVRPNTIEDPSGYSVRYNIESETHRREVIDEVLWACGEIIEHGDKTLPLPAFDKPFRQLCADIDDYSVMEHIWVLPFANGARGQIMGFNSPKIGSSDIVKLNGKIPGIGDGAKSNGHICITPYLLYQFEPNDTRRDVTCVPGVWAYDDKSVNGLPSEARAYQKSQNIKSYYLAKYRYEWMTRTSTGEDGIDFPILRYADVLLMYAEAALGTSHTDKGLGYLNEVRKRAGLSNLPTYDLAAIQTERAKEFCGEYIRKWDLMRWGILKDEVLKSEAFARTIMGEADVISTELNGKAIDISTKIWYKYRQDPAINNAWVMDSIYGLYPGETNKPAYFNKNTGWIEKKAIFGSDEKGWDFAKSTYPFYLNADQLELRQYWPIFPHYITASNGNLWNNYGY